MAVTTTDINTVLADAQGGATATGTITITTSQLPSANDTITVNGTVVTFVASGATGNQINIAGNTNAMATAIAAALSASTNTNITKATYSAATNVVTVTFRVPGTTGNAFTLAKSGTNISVSGATLTGGSNASTTDYAPTSAGGVVSDINADSSFEKNLLSIVALVETAVLGGDDPSANLLNARKQRKLLSSLLHDLAAALKPAAQATDDRTAVATFVRQKVLKKYDWKDTKRGS